MTDTVISKIINQRELLQNDLQCILDGLDNKVINLVCQAVIDRFDIVLEDAVLYEQVVSYCLK